MSNNYEYKDKLKTLLPTYLAILEDEGLTSHRSDNYWDCPFCGSGTGVNQTPAFHLYDGGEKYHCFSCDESGDIFDLVRFAENMKDAIYPKIYARTYKLMKPYLDSAIKNQKDEKECKKDAKHQVRNDYTSYLSKCQNHCRETDYFKARGLSERTINKFGLGYDTNKNIVTIPYNIDNPKTGYIHRALWDCDAKYIKHGNELFNIKALYIGNEDFVFIVEGQFDAMSIEEIGYPALGLSGTNEIDKLVDLLKIRPCNKTLILALDNDIAGQKATGKLISLLAERQISCDFLVCSWLYGDHKDANEFLLADRAGFVKKLGELAEAIKKMKETEDTSIG